MKRRGAVMVMVAIFFLGVLAVAGPSWAGGEDPPGKWQVILVDNGTDATWPTTYTIRTARAGVVPYQIKYTFGGTGNLTLTEECSIDGTNFVVLETVFATSSANQDLIDVITWSDTATVVRDHPMVPCMVTRLVLTAAGGTPSLTALFVSYMRKN